jgi:hypothetical protein
MNVHIVFADFARCGTRLIPEPPNLIVEPASLPTDQDREAIRTHKSELLAALALQSEQADSSPGRISDHEEDECDRLAEADGWHPPSQIPDAVAAEIPRIESVALALG